MRPLKVEMRPLKAAYRDRPLTKVGGTDRLSGQVREVPNS